MPRTELEPRFFVRATDNWVRLAARFVVPLRTARAIEDDLTRRALTRYEEARIEIASATVEATLRFTDGQPPAWASGGSIRRRVSSAPRAVPTGIAVATGRPELPTAARRQQGCIVDGRDPMPYVPPRESSRFPSPLLTQEILDSVAAQAALTPTYLLYMTASGVLAAVALLSSSVPILIGSMVVAPALAPLVLVPLALVAGRRALAGRGLAVALLGLSLAFVAAAATTVLMNAVGVIPPDTHLLDKPLLEERVRPGWWSMAAAVAAGLVGTVAQATAKTDTLVGTVAALALVPAGAAAAIALLSSDPRRAVGGLLLLAVNVGLIIAMGIVALLATSGRAGLRPALLLPVGIVVLAGLLLAWAQASGTVPEAPPSGSITSGPAGTATTPSTPPAGAVSGPGAAG